LAFEFFLAISQSRLIGLNLMRTPADLGRFLCGHAAVFVQFHRVAIHGRLPPPVTPPNPRHRDLSADHPIGDPQRVVWRDQNNRRQRAILPQDPEAIASANFYRLMPYLPFRLRALRAA
jgi:hypothetical protein